MKRHITNIVSNIFYKFASKEFNPFIQNIINKSYVKLMGLDMSEFKNPSDYKSLNELFTRKLEVNRDIEDDFISPCDAFITELGTLDNSSMLQIKGMYYDVEELLTSNISEENFSRIHNGKYINFYLSPKDYHRYHIPIDCKITKVIHIPGKLYPVNIPYLKKKPKLFIENERVVLECLYNEKLFYMVFVGALNVGKMVFNFEPRIKTNNIDLISVYEYKDLYLKKAQELGYFMMGSTIVMVWERDFVSLEKIFEQKVRFGEKVASILKV